jgi:translation initiation factor 4G
MAERTPEFKEGAKTINFRRILLTRCYEALIEEPETASIPPASNGTQNGSATTSSVSPPQHSWRRQCMLQNVCLIGELFRRQLLTENVMHVCVAMMLEDEVNPQMDVIDAACRLLMLVRGRNRLQFFSSALFAETPT